MADSFDDFFAASPRASLTRGGARPNAGRKATHGKYAKKQAAPTPEEAENEPSAYQRYEKARAEKEEALARQAAVKADLDEARVVDREAVITAAARAFAACSQSLDAIGDTLEREGISIEVCERVMQVINAAKEQLATDLERTHSEHAG